MKKTYSALMQDISDLREEYLVAKTDEERKLIDYEIEAVIKQLNANKNEYAKLTTVDLRKSLNSASSYEEFSKLKDLINEKRIYELNASKIDEMVNEGIDVEEPFEPEFNKFIFRKFKKTTLIGVSCVTLGFLVVSGFMHVAHKNNNSSKQDSYVPKNNYETTEENSEYINDTTSDYINDDTTTEYIFDTTEENTTEYFNENTSKSSTKTVETKRNNSNDESNSLKEVKEKNNINKKTTNKDKNDNKTNKKTEDNKENNKTTEEKKENNKTTEENKETKPTTEERNDNKNNDDSKKSNTTSEIKKETPEKAPTVIKSEENKPTPAPADNTPYPGETDIIIDEDPNYPDPNMPIESDEEDVTYYKDNETTPSSSETYEDLPIDEDEEDVTYYQSSLDSLKNSKVLVKRLTI